jgi:hypothetical protein
MNRDEAMTLIEDLARQYRQRRESDPAWFDTTKNMIKMLAQDINSQDLHFVYELIQNAEDNCYPPECPEPSVEFTLEAGRIVVRNNEVGFNPANVKAICDITVSSKVGRTLGFIGEKGIGFKSVFKVSTAPQIHSNGYHFAFDDQEFVVPHWCEPPADASVDPSMTTIVLPLRDEVFEDPEQSLHRDFLNLPSETLLFLSKLKRIRIHDRVKGTSRELRRHEGRKGIIVIDEGQKSTRWRINRRDIAVPKWLSEQKRQGVHRRELILGFLTDSRGACLRLANATVFAFLPTTLKPGFPFLIQGDFLTTANRESIHEGHKWNRWLRDELVATYIEAIGAGVAESEPFRLSFLQSLPLAEEITGAFFKPVAERILDEIFAKPFLPGDSGRLRTAEEVFRGDQTLRRLFPSSVLAELLGRDTEYLDPRFAIPQVVEEYVPIADIGTELLTLLSNSDWLEQQNDDWFIDLYGYLGEHTGLVDDGDTKGLSIVRLEGGQLAAPDDGTIYLPPSEERVEESYGLKQFEFRIVSHAIVRRNPNPRTEKEKLVNRRTQAARAFLLDHLEVKYHRPLEIARYQILPYFKAWTYDSVHDLKDDFGLVRYVKDHWEQIKKDIDEDETNYSLEKIVSELCRLPIPVIGVRGSREVRAVAEAYLPPELGGDPALARLFQGVPDVPFVDADTLIEWDTTRKRRDRKLKEWLAFLWDIGAYRGLRVFRQPWHSLFSNEATVPVPDDFSSSHRVTSITNHFEIEHVENLFDYLRGKAPSTRIERGKLLLKLLDRQWSEWESKFAPNRRGTSPWWHSTYRFRAVLKPQGRDEERSLACAFLQRLRREEWVPVRGDGLPKRPGDVWFGDNDGALGFSEGRCLAVPLENQDLVRALGFHTRLTVAKLVDILKERRERRDCDVIGYRHLYSLLDQACQEEGNWDLLSQEFKSDSRLIYLPDRLNSPFAASDEVVWTQSQSRRYKGFPSLATTYPALREFFLKLEVAERATPQLALETLSLVSDSFDSHVDERKRELDRIRIWEAYETLAAAGCGIDETDEELEEFRSKGTLLAVNGGFYRCSDLIAPDDAELARLFSEQGVEPFLSLPDPAEDAIDLARSLVRLFGLKPASSAQRHVWFEPHEGVGKCERIRELFDGTRRSLLGYIRKNARERYEMLRAGGQAGVLAKAEIRVCTSITVGYRFDGRSFDDPRKHSIYLDPDAKLIYLSANGLDDLLELGAALQSALAVDGLAEGFYTLMNLDPGLREQHTKRQGYSVPETEWQEIVGPTPEPTRPPKDPDGAPTSEPPKPNDQAGPEPPTIPGGTRKPAITHPPSDPGPSKPPKNGAGRDRSGGGDWKPPKEGKSYNGPKNFSPPRASNALLIKKLGEIPRRREAGAYLQGPPAEEPGPVGQDPDVARPTRIRTTIYAVNLEYGFLRFAPADFRIFEPDLPAQIEVVGDDEQETTDVFVDYPKGILHGGENLTGFLEVQAWTYGTILWLETTGIPGRYHLHAMALEEPLSIDQVAYFDFDEYGEPIVLNSYPEPFSVKIEENIYRQERRWENRRAFEKLVERRDEGVLTAVFKALESEAKAMSATAIHRQLMADRPCSYFSVLAVLYGYECFEKTESHHWQLATTEPRELRSGYRALLEPPETPRKDSGQTGGRVAPPLAADEVSRLEEELRVLSQFIPDRWIAATDRLLQELNRIRSSLAQN